MHKTLQFVLNQEFSNSIMKRIDLNSYFISSIEIYAVLQLK
jgi:hypothetical protein